MVNRLTRSYVPYPLGCRESFCDTEYGEVLTTGGSVGPSAPLRCWSRSPAIVVQRGGPSSKTIPECRARTWYQPCPKSNSEKSDRSIQRSTSTCLDAGTCTIGRSPWSRNRPRRRTCWRSLKRLDEVLRAFWQESQFLASYFQRTYAGAAIRIVNGDVDA